jgi:CBS-domain-containing membrane protein
MEVDHADPVPEVGEDDPASAFFWEWWEDTDADASEHMSSSDTPQMLDRHVVEEVMTHTPLLTLPPSATIEHAARIMETARVHRVLVTEGAKLLGLVTSFDIAKAVGEDRLTKRVYVFGRAGPSSRKLVC